MLESAAQPRDVASVLPPSTATVSLRLHHHPAGIVHAHSPQLFIVINLSVRLAFQTSPCTTREASNTRGANAWKSTNRKLPPSSIGAIPAVDPDKPPMSSAPLVPHSHRRQRQVGYLHLKHAKYIPYHSVNSHKPIATGRLAQW